MEDNKIFIDEEDIKKKLVKCFRVLFYDKFSAEKQDEVEWNERLGREIKEN